MINITSCDLAGFTQFMNKQFGPQQFSAGFDLIKKNQDLIYHEDGEERLVKMLTPVLRDDDKVRGFINFCTTFLIVQNMQFGQ